MLSDWQMLGQLGSYAGTAAQAVGNAATTAGGAIGNAATSLAQSTGIPRMANALGQLGSEAGPAGVEMPGYTPGLADTGPGFWGGFQQGFNGILGQYADQPSFGTQFGQGLGMLGNFLDQNRGGGQMNAGQLLRSALAQYGIPETRRPMTGPIPQQQGGLFSLHLGGSTGM